MLRITNYYLSIVSQYTEASRKQFNCLYLKKNLINIYL